ncbi:hypothetical protein, partial [Streptomyces bohaiensis]
PTLIHLSFSDLHAYPEDGFSQPFDTASGGILTGQGAGMLAARPPPGTTPAASGTGRRGSTAAPRGTPGAAARYEM